VGSYIYCIVNNEDDDESTIRGATLNKLLVFPVWVSRVKYLCIVCVCACHCVFFVFIKNLFVVIYCTRLEYTMSCLCSREIFKPMFTIPYIYLSFKLAFLVVNLFSISST
jgi:hypothetical protein